MTPPRSVFRDSGCRDCRQITSGDCGQHGPRYIPVSAWSSPPSPPRSVEEWAKDCQHGMIGLHGKLLCQRCAAAYAAEQVAQAHEPMDCGHCPCEQVFLIGDGEKPTGPCSGCEQVAQARGEIEQEIVGSEVERNLEEWGLYAEIKAERVRQELLKAAGKFMFSAKDADLGIAVAILMEEVGEVAREAMALLGVVKESGDRARYRKELIQVAAVAVAMIEANDAAALRARRDEG